MATKIKTEQLAGAALNWAVRSCEGKMSDYVESRDNFSSSWNKAGPIIERERISIIRCDDDYGKDAKGFTNSVRIPVWAAEHGGGHSTHTCYEGEHYDPQYEIAESECSYGPTPLIAAMRCFVTYKLGKEIDIPSELLGQNLSNDTHPNPSPAIVALECVSSGMYFGKILKIKNGIATQKVGMTDDVVVHHDISKLRNEFRVNMDVDIHYSGGVGTVYRKDRGIER